MQPDQRQCPLRRPLTVDAAVTGGATECNRTFLDFLNANQVAGNIAVTCKVTSYPFSVRFDASGPHYLPADETRTCTACGSYTSDWAVSPYVWFDQYPIVVWGCGRIGGFSLNPQRLDDGKVTVSGGLTGTGITPGAMTLTGFVQEKVGVTPAQLKATWTVEHDRYDGATYDSDQAAQHVNDSAPLGGWPGSLCSMGGYPGPVSADYVCAGCPLPIKRVLHATILGEPVVLTYIDQFYSWFGTFTKTMLSRTCPPNPNDSRRSVGLVAFRAQFQYIADNVGGPGQLAYFSIRYSSNAQNEPVQCPDIRGDDSVAISGSYGHAVSRTVSCDPFEVTADGDWHYSLARDDFSGLYDEYSLPVNLTISE